MDWSLFQCGRTGHVTYAPDEPGLQRHMRAQATAAELWRCLRCGTFVTGGPHAAGPAAEAPLVRRGKEIRGDFLLRLFAIDRFSRFLLFGAISYAIWRFSVSGLTITQAIDREFPIVRSLFGQLGLSIEHTGLMDKVRHLLHASQGRLSLVAAAIALLAVIALIEGVGLWLARRWGEYFAFVATSLFLPAEVYEIWAQLTWTKVILFALNLALVLYLVLNRRLFGVRGGKEAYEARLRSESVLDEAAAAAAATTAPADLAQSDSDQAAATA